MGLWRKALRSSCRAELVAENQKISRTIQKNPSYSTCLIQIAQEVSSAGVLLSRRGMEDVDSDVV